MNLSFSDDDLSFQKEVRAWLEENWDQESRTKSKVSALGRLSKEDHIRWQKRLAEKGWAAPNWPTEHGGAGFTANQNYLFDLELARVGAPSVIPFGITMVAPVIMKFGNDAQKDFFLPDQIVYPGPFFVVVGGAGVELLLLSSSEVSRLIWFCSSALTSDIFSASYI